MSGHGASAMRLEHGKLNRKFNLAIEPAVCNERAGGERV